MSAAPPLIHLSAADVRRALPMTDAIDAMEDAFRELAAGRVTMPARTHLDVPEHRGVLLVMPSHAAGAARLAIKEVSLFAGNADAGLPMLSGLIVLADGATGMPLAVMDGAAATALRTGAVSGLATRLLAREDAEHTAVFGAGPQAQTQLEAVCAVRGIRSARVCDPDIERARVFAAEMGARLAIEVDIAASTRDVLRGADVVCTATTSREPVFDDEDVPDGAHINAIGSFKPHVVEIPAATVARARVVVDLRGAALEEAGDLIAPIRAGIIGADHVGLELGDLLAGRATGRETRSQVTLFKSVGLAVEDLFAASRAYENARRLGIGAELKR